MNFKNTTMKIDKCKLFGHRWTPCYIKGDYNGKTIKFIACNCSRCMIGFEGLYEINEIGLNQQYGTRNEKYYK